MFTGLVEEVGHLRSVASSKGSRRLWIDAARVLDGTRVGDSVAVDGVCLTATAIDARGFAVDVVPETLSRTTLGARVALDAVNLERPLRLDQRLGGHLVQGHVDGVGTVARVLVEGDGLRLGIDVPRGLERFIAEKGSIAVDGVSLTVAGCEGQRFEIALIPHTLAATTASAYTPGRSVNLEVDVIARYAARLLEVDSGSRSRP